MIEETGRIVAVSDQIVSVETVRTSACDTCKARKGCGHGLINEVSSGQSFVLEVKRNGQEANVGDIATIGVPEDALIKASLISYLLPIVLLIVLAGIGKLIGGESISIMAGLFGLFLGFLLVKKLGASESLSEGPVLISVQPSNQIDVVPH